MVAVRQFYPSFFPVELGSGFSVHFPEYGSARVEQLRDKSRDGGDFGGARERVQAKAHDFWSVRNAWGEELCNQRLQDHSDDSAEEELEAQHVAA